MPIYVMPYYNSEGPGIDVGEFSTQLSMQSASQLRATTSEMKARWADLKVEAMYVASVRLYDLGLKDESVYWFYSAQYRSRLYQSLLDRVSNGGMGTDSLERCRAYNAFQELAGEYINGYAFEKINTLLEIIDRVRVEGKDMPNLAAIYPNDTFVPEVEWRKRNDELSAGLASLAKNIKEDADEIRASRERIGESEIRFQGHLRRIDELRNSGVIDHD